MFADEYTPILGSAPIQPKRQKAFLTGGIALFLVGLLAITTLGPEAAVVAPLALDAQPALNTASIPVAETAAAATADVASPVAASEAQSFSSFQYNLIYNFLSFAIAAMGASTVFFFFQFSMVHKDFRTALIVSALVTLIAFYHYLRIFNSFTGAYVLENGVVSESGVPFNDAYRYVDWLLTVPLLLMEIILVMKLPPHETRQQCIQLGVSAALMIILGYPGEISDASGTRWIFWCLAMIPFLFIVYTLFVGLSGSIRDQPREARGLVSTACWVTVVSWCTYPIVFIFPMLGLSGYGAKTAIQLGYSLADVIAKPVLGLVVWQIAVAKSEAKYLESDQA